MDNGLYITGWCIIGTLLLLVLFIKATNIQLSKYLFPCVLHSLTGLYCPGCGGTRAITALLHGQILNSFLYHPVVLYSAGLFLRIFVVSGLGAVKNGHFSCSKKLRKHDIFWILFLTTAHFLIINGCKLFLGLDLFKQI